MCEGGVHRVTVHLTGGATLLIRRRGQCGDHRRRRPHRWRTVPAWGRTAGFTALSCRPASILQSGLQVLRVASTCAPGSPTRWFSRGRCPTTSFIRPSTPTAVMDGPSSHPLGTEQVVCGSRTPGSSRGRTFLLTPGPCGLARTSLVVTSPHSTSVLQDTLRPPGTVAVRHRSGLSGVGESAAVRCHESVTSRYVRT